MYNFYQDWLYYSFKLSVFNLWLNSPTYPCLIRVPSVAKFAFLPPNLSPGALRDEQWRVFDGSSSRRVPNGLPPGEGGDRQGDRRSPRDRPRGLDVPVHRRPRP